AGDDCNLYRVFPEKRDLLVRATEQHRVAALEAHHGAVAPRGVEQLLVDEVLRGREPPAALAYRDQLRLRGEREDLLGDERVVKDDVRLAEQPGRAQREEFDCARPGADEMDRARGHRSNPAATVRLVASSMRMNEPVACTAS